MIKWRYGIVLHKDNIKDYYGIHEIYTNDQVDMTISDLPITVGDSVEEIINDLKIMLSDIQNNQKITVVDHTKTILSKELVDELKKRKEEAEKNPENLISLDDLKKEINKKILENYQERCEFYEHSIIEHYNSEENPSEADKKLWNNKIIQGLLSLQKLIDHDQELGLYWFIFFLF